MKNVDDAIRSMNLKYSFSNLNNCFSRYKSEFDNKGDYGNEVGKQINFYDYKSSWDVYNDIYFFKSLKIGGRYDLYTWDNIMYIIKKMSSIAQYLLENNIFEIDELLDESFKFILNFFPRNFEFNGTRADINMKKRLVEVKKLTDLVSQFNVIKDNNMKLTTNEIIKKQELLIVGEFMKANNGKKYNIVEYDNEGVLTYDIRDTISGRICKNGREYMLFVLNDLSIALKEANDPFFEEISQYEPYLGNFYLTTPKYSRNGIDSDVLKMQVKLKKFKSRIIL